MEQTEKTALVTGASRGIGRITAIMLAQRGFTVAVNYLVGFEDEANEVKDTIEKEGGRAITVPGDVSKAEDVEAMIAAVKEQFGHIDLLVNNAGITRDGLLMRMKEIDWDLVLNIDLKSVFLTTKAVAPIMMKQRSGAIVNVASVVGITGNIGQVNYSAAKAGVIGVTKTSAKELAGRGIRVNAVAPGFIQTSMTAVIPENIKEEMLRSVPLSRMGQPEDVAKAICFLASDEAAYITGQVLKVDGGMVM
jgi:3-oxoacyl-[acyl-carrier protein] reductase